MVFLMAQLVKNPPAMQETPVLFLGQKDLLEKGICYPLQYSWVSLVAQLVKNRFYFTYLLFYSVSFLRQRILAFNQLQEIVSCNSVYHLSPFFVFFIYTPTDNVLDLSVKLLIVLTFLSGILLFVCAHCLGNFFTYSLLNLFSVILFHLFLEI